MINRRAFRTLVEAKDILILPGVFNGYSVRLVERYGYKAAAISGAGLSESLLGFADRGILTFDQNLRACEQLAACTGIPLLADADTGYGNALNVHLVTRAFERAGLAAISIEDQVWPKRCGHMKGKSVIAAEEMVSKVKAACDARHDPDFVIIARTDAAGTHNVDEAIRRLNLYAQAGADCLYADALLSKEDIAKVAKNVPKPLIVNMGMGMRSRNTTPLMTPKELETAGVAVVSYPRMLTTAAMRGMMNALEVFTSEVVGKNKLVDRSDLQVSFEEGNELMGMSELDELERRFNGG